MRIKNNRSFIFLFCLILISGFSNDFIIADSNDESPVKKNVYEEWRDTLRFGISDQILDVIKKIKDAKETSLNDEIAAVLSKTISLDIKKAIIDYFIDCSFKGAEGIAIGKVAAYEDEDKQYIANLIRYLGEIKSDFISKNAEKYVDLSDDDISNAMIQAIGKVKDISKGKYLLTKLLDIDFPVKRKTTIVLILGELSYKEAVPALLDILKNKDEDKGLRMFACEALGKIKDDKAVTDLKNIFKENDALLKVYAAAALASFNMDDVIDILIEGLKDSNWKVRVQSAKACAQKNAVKAVDILMWKIKNDSVRDVKIESLKALGEIGTKQCFDFTRDIFKNDAESAEIRVPAMEICVNKDFGNSYATVINVIGREWDKPLQKQKFLETIASALASINSGLLVDIFSKFMDSNNMIVRAYGIRGAASNNFTSLRDKISHIAEHDPVESIKREAQRALGKL